VSQHVRTQSTLKRLFSLKVLFFVFMLYNFCLLEVCLHLFLLYVLECIVPNHELYDRGSILYRGKRGFLLASAFRPASGPIQPSV
jgi:hypothetical protein